MREHAIIRAGGLALIAGAMAFLGVFAFLAARFNYPAVLDGSAAEVLPRLLATGAPRAVRCGQPTGSYRSSGFPRVSRRSTPSELCARGACAPGCSSP